jgi:hypothetical protein
MTKADAKQRRQSSKGFSLLGVCSSLPSIMTLFWSVLMVSSIHFFASPPDAAWAQGNESSFRCGTDIIVLGDSNYRVLAKCGPPSAKEFIGTNYRYAMPPGEFNDIEQWMYNRGPTDFVYTLRIQGGSVIDIARGGRGF